MLVSHPDLSADALAAAELMVAAELGCPGLDVRQVVEAGTLGNSGIIALRGGPCTAITALTLDGAPAAGVLQSPWAVNLGGLASRSTNGYARQYTISYTAGWTVETLPQQLRQAVIMTAQALEARPDPSLKSESEGPVSRTWDTAQGLHPQVGALLNLWQPLRF